MSKKPLKVGYLSPFDPLSRWSWSGIHYYMFNSLAARGLAVSHLGHSLLERTTWFQRAFRRLGVGWDVTHPGPAGSLDESRQWVSKLSGELAGNAFDVILAPAAAVQVGFLETSLPIVYVSDSTLQLMRGYYALYSSLPEDDSRALEDLESRAISKSSRLVFSSSWAADSAMADYGAPPSRVRVVPFGANLDEVPSAMVATDKRSQERCRLLFLGRDWERKGGNIAFECLLKLLDLGLDAELIVCGCTPPKEARHKKLVGVGALDKARPRQRARLAQLLLRTHFLVLPTQADCTPVALCEANAFGVPAICTRTGGIPSVIEEGRNGLLLPLEARGEEFASAIAQIFRNPPRYKAMVLAARQAYDERLNWRAWANSVHNELSAVAG